jgi:hypothetical protein
MDICICVINFSNNFTKTNMAKEYKINTVQDMINATNSENLERFLDDLRELLRCSHAFNSIASKGGELESDGFLWIDDDKKEINITIHEKKRCGVCGLEIHPVLGARCASDKCPSSN